MVLVAVEEGVGGVESADVAWGEGAEAAHGGGSHR